MTSSTDMVRAVDGPLAPVQSYGGDGTACRSHVRCEKLRICMKAGAVTAAAQEGLVDVLNSYRDRAKKAPLGGNVLGAQ